MARAAQLRADRRALVGASAGLSSPAGAGEEMMPIPDHRGRTLDRDRALFQTAHHEVGRLSDNARSPDP